MIALHDASVRLGKVQALSGFTGTFPAGVVTALIGGDGAGKSTLLRALAGRVTITPAQSIAVNDRREIGYQPADAGVWRNLSVNENIEFVSRVYGLSGSRTRARADELLRRAGLDHARNRVAGRLSGGMRQKLGFVLATLHQPGLVLLDEPTTGVDPVSRGELWTLIAGAAADGAAVVFATTYLDEAERAAQLFLLGDGKLLASGAPDDVIAHAPGRIWRASTRSESSVEERMLWQSPHAWCRGTTAYLWTPDPHLPAPAGFEPDTPDLENTSIALLLEEEDTHEKRQPTAKESVDADHTDPRRDVTTETPARTSSAILVQASDVERRYGAFAALRGVSLDVAPGEIVGLLGGNGAGKTTLMRIILGLEKPSAGTCSLFGEEPSLETRRRIGYVAQGLGLYPSLSAIENLHFAASVQGVPVSARAAEFAHGLGDAPVAKLPLGAQRVLAYYAASQHDPDLLILDEPTSGMDALTRARLWKDLRETAERGIGILVTTHYMQEAAQCDRLVILTAGEVSASGTAQEITAKHTSLVIRTDHWDQAFRLLRNEGLPVLLDGRAVRLPGITRAEATAVLTPIAGKVHISESNSTLEEAMMLATVQEKAAPPEGASSLP